MQKILIVDDDRSACFAIATFLKTSFALMAFHDGWDILENMRKFAPDLILLDINLPGPNGFKLLKQIKAQAGEVPVFMISIRGGEEDLLKAFELGAADYLIKPFSLAILKARINRWLQSRSPESLLRLGSVEVNFQTGEIRHSDRIEKMTRKEILVLRCLWTNSGKIIDRQQILNYAWGYEYEGTQRTVDNVIASLRQKLGNVENKDEMLESCRGLGYRLKGKS
ncbi:MAG: response regulator transcription factor [Candidatus Riflebacteria bacterium]|nr:response regulator transcription factor [Candidatus Riflebacteria bacterium]